MGIINDVVCITLSREKPPDTTTLITTRGILSVYSLVTNKIEIGIYELLTYFLFSVVKLHLCLIEELNSELYSEKQLAIVENYTVVTGVSRPTSSRFATSNILVLVNIDLWKTIKIKIEVGIQISNCLPRLTNKNNNMQGTILSTPFETSYWDSTDIFKS